MTNAVPSIGDGGERVYHLLIDGSDPDAADAFDIHVTACILALAPSESADCGSPLPATTGLAPDVLLAIAGTMFPGAAGLFGRGDAACVQPGADEACLLDLLCHCTTAATPFELRLAGMIARRAQSPNHLWQDLGLRNRGELSELMQRHFRVLASRNVSDMKWKKFLYRMICRDAGYSLCTAPSCSECADFDNCFGDESGESRLARIRREDELQRNGAGDG